MPHLLDMLKVFICSMVPVIELRGAIPMGKAFDMPWYLTLVISVIGNCLPVPFILLFIRKILKWMKTVKHLDKIALWLEEKAQHKSQKVMRFASAGLFLLVAIPLPGTGAWTGSLVAALMDMRFKYALPSIFAGVLCAGVIVTLVVELSVGALKLFVG